MHFIIVQDNRICYGRMYIRLWKYAELYCNEQLICAYLFFFHFIKISTIIFGFHAWPDMVYHFHHQLLGNFSLKKYNMIWCFDHVLSECDITPWLHYTNDFSLLIQTGTGICYFIISFWHYIQQCNIFHLSELYSYRSMCRSVNQLLLSVELTDTGG